MIADVGIQYLVLSRDELLPFEALSVLVSDLLHHLFLCDSVPFQFALYLTGHFVKHLEFLLVVRELEVRDHLPASGPDVKSA